MILEFLLLIVTLTVAWIYFNKRVKNFPPGPIGLPLLGHLPLLGTHPHITLWKWKKTYGPIVGVWFGSYRTVVISDTKLIREAMGMSAFTGRPRLNFFKARTEDGSIKGMVLTDGQQWVEQRRFALRNLRDFGLGTKTMEAKVMDEINELLERFKAKEGKPMQVKNIFLTPVINALWSIMFGERMAQDNPETLEAFHQLTETLDKASLLGTLSIFMPWLATIAPKLSGFKEMIRDVPAIVRFLTNQIEKHEASYTQDQPRDFVDIYTDEVKKTKDPQSSFHEKHGVLLYTVFDMFGAGSDTTNTTLTWLIAYLVHHTQVQEKLQNEIDEVVGKQRQPALNDRPAMPYTEAVINETLRFSTILPFAIFHRATEDVNFHGFFIPKDTLVIPNVYSAHFDESWGDPQNFRPERFIDENGKFKKNENLIPFSTGKRVCIGEGLSRDELFLFTTNIFQAFSVTAAGELPNLEPHLGFVLTPKAFEIILKNRLE